MTTKTCTQCKVTREICLFINSKDKQCKTCEKCRERGLKSRQKRNELQKQYNKQWRKQNKERVQLYNKSQREGKQWSLVKEEQKIVDAPKVFRRKEHVVLYDISGKNCCKCKEWKPLERYNKCSSHWDGLKVTCMDCYYEYRKKNKDRITEYNKKYWVETKDEQTEKHREWKEKNKQYVNEYQRKYQRIWEKFQRETNPQYKITKNLRCRLYSALKQQNIKKTQRTLDLIDCSIDFLKQWLESKFKDGMSWENYGKWHIDHIKPCAKFNLTYHEEQKKCFNYKNLQPLWASENISKGCKWDSDEE